MFRQFQNIDTAFKHIRWFAIALICCTTIISCIVIFTSHQTVQRSQGKVYVIQGGGLQEAAAADRMQYIDVEMKDHIKNFHNLFFSLEPDEQFINRSATSALYLADISAKQEYDNLKESGYYSEVIASNVSQRVLPPDSIQINLSAEPYQFNYYGKVRIVRATSIVTRSVITTGYIRLSKISENNPHGMLIERWRILANSDLSIEKR